MIIVGEKKYACESCIKGHRSSGCKHNDRPLFEVKRKGRPITQCEHCRELRKTKQVHVKCMCEGTPNAEASPAASVSGEASSVSSASSIGALSVKSAGKKRVKKPLPEAAFPIGLPSETIEASAALQILSEGGYPSEDVNVHACSCKNTNECSCWSHRSRPAKSGSSSSSSHSLPLDSHSKSTQTHYRAVLPRPPNRRRTSDASLSSLNNGPVHDPSEDHLRVHGRHSSFYSPYGRAYEYAGLMDQSKEAYPPPPPSTCSESSFDDQLSLPYHHSNQSREFDFDLRYAAPPPSGYTDAPTQSYRGESQIGVVGNAGGRVQPHHEAPFAPPQTPTDVPFLSWPVTLSPFSQRDPRSFAAMDIGARAPMEVDSLDVPRPSLLLPSIGRAGASQAQGTSDAGIEAMLDLPLCGCGDTCACPGCVQHAGAQIAANAYDLCTNPPACAMCLQCSILALPEPELGMNLGYPAPGAPQQDRSMTQDGQPDTQVMNMGMMGGMMDIDEWLRSVAPHDDSTSGHAYASSVHSVDYSNAAYAFGEDAPPAPTSDRADGEFYDVAFDPNLLATWDPPPDPNGEMNILPELFLPDLPSQGQPYPPEYGGYDHLRLTTFATSGARDDDHGPTRPELLVIPPTPAMRAGSGLGLSRADTLDAEAENARYLAAHLAALSHGGAPSPDSSGGGSSPHSDVALSGSNPRRNSTGQQHVQGSSLSSSDSSSLDSSVFSGSSAQMPTHPARTQSSSKFKLFSGIPGIFGGNRNRFS